jgi:hypothetical protein
MPIIIPYVKGIVHKEFALACQSIPHTTVTFYDENVRRLRSELWRQNNWVLYHENAPSFFTREFLPPKQRDCCPQPNLLFSVSPIENNTERPQFDTIEIIQAELQMVLNTLTEHHFRDAFKKWQ